MIKIGICDNDIEVLEQMRSILSPLAFTQELDFKLIFFSSGEELIKFYDSNHLDILLLDIELDNCDGIDIAGMIRNNFYDKEVKIIFVSSYSDYVFKSFDVSAYHYLVKPFDSNKLSELVLRLYHELTKDYGDNFFVLKLKLTGEKQIVRKDQIISLELIDSPKRLISVTTMKESFNITGRLNTYWEELTDYGFLKIYRSIIINLHYLKKISNSSVIMDNDMEFPLSRKVKKEINEIYSKFMVDTYSKKRDLE